jgi:hypothetical protein
MAIALRSARFISKNASLEIRECADRTQIQIVAESDGTVYDRYVLTLSASDWAKLIRLPYLHRAERDRRAQTPANVLGTFTLVDDMTSLEIRERPDRESVQIIIRDLEDGDEDGASIELTAEQWLYLCRLDYVTRKPLTDFPPPPPERPHATVH